MAKPTLDEANAVERTTPLRMKFVPMDYRGGAIPDASTDYDDFFTDLPEGWRAEPIGIVTTRTESEKPAWYLTDGQTEVIAVEHETGLELLLIAYVAPLVAPVVTALVVESVIRLTQWSWKRWTTRRKEKGKPDPAFTIEVPRVDAAGAPPIQIVVTAPVRDEDIPRYARLARELAQGH